MLKRIGFDESDVGDYLELFSKKFDKYDYKLSNRENWFINAGNCISAIKGEFDLKRSLQFKDKKSSTLISATDLSNFSFCPASYSINSSFEIELQNGIELTEEGKKLHEELKAIKKSWVKEKEEEILNVNKHLSNIKKSKTIFIGHNSENKPFYNENWIGTPDYILEDIEGQKYIVEEKFRYKYDPSKNSGAYFDSYTYCWEVDESLEETYREEEEEWKKSKVLFYKNNVVQVISYLLNIKEYELKYGILIYWYYDFTKDKKPYVHKVATKKVIINSELEQDYKIIKSKIETLQKNIEIEFDIESINLNKCTNCVVANYCGHKTKQFSKLNFPYSKNYPKLKYEPFPESLKKTAPN